MENIKIRKATIDDLDLIFEWANDPDERRNAFNSEPILYENHVKWYQSKMKSDDTYIFILMCDDIPVGQCRLDIEDGDALISYFIDHEYRNKGYGKKLLNLIYDKVKTQIPTIKTLTAEVKEENVPSQRVFLSLGYSEKIDTSRELREYKLPIQ